LSEFWEDEKKGGEGFNRDGEQEGPKGQRKYLPCSFQH
jgi:hypothetical protein